MQRAWTTGSERDGSWPLRLERVDLGGVVIDVLPEQESPVFHPTRFFHGLEPGMLDRHRAELRASGALADDDRLVLSVQTYVVRTAETVILVDTCVGNDKAIPAVPEWDRSRLPFFLGNLARLGLTPNDVDIIVSTHLHGDHVGWNTTLHDGVWEPTFPSARYLFVRPELDPLLAARTEQTRSVLAESIDPVLERGRSARVEPDAELASGVRLRPAHGHSPGHVIVEVRGTRGRAFVTGDLLHSPLQLREPTLRMVLDHDPELARETRQAVLTEAAAEGVLLCTGHFPRSSIVTVERHGDGFRETPAAAELVEEPGLGRGPGPAPGPGPGPGPR